MSTLRELVGAATGTTRRRSDGDLVLGADRTPGRRLLRWHVVLLIIDIDDCRYL
jgi:hypothetical protein